MKYLKLLVCFSFIFLSIPVNAQEIQADVTVILDQLSNDAQVDVQTMENDLEKYINYQRFMKKDWEGPRIPVSINIALQGRAGSYSARVHIISRRFLDGPEEASSINAEFLDDQWSFNYTRFANLTYDDMRYHEFTSLIDYYMLLIIGLDLDTYEEHGGNRAFEKAKQICLIGNSAGDDGFKTSAMMGEFTRYGLVSELTDLRFEEFRTIIFDYYYNCLDQIAFDKEKALEGIKDIVRRLADFKRNKLSTGSIYLSSFFDAKHEELASSLKDIKDQKMFEDLKYLDPMHANIYTQFFEGR